MELIELNEEDLKEIAELTALNCHSDAYVKCAEVLGADDLVEKFKTISSIQERSGYLTPYNSVEQYSLYKKMMGLAKTLLSKEDYSRFYMAT